MTIRISVLVSGGGSNLQALLDAQDAGALGPGRIVQVVSGNKNAYALVRAKEHGIPAIVIDKENWPDPADRNRAILSALRAAATDLVVLAGYMNVLSPEVVQAYRGRMVNIHPALIPRHCGMGMYGMRVHRAVLESGDAESGATVHLVDEGVDTGRILRQEAVPVMPGDSPESLAARVLAAEHRILPQAVAALAEALEATKNP